MVFHNNMNKRREKKQQQQRNVYRVTKANTLNKFFQMKSKLKKYEIAMGGFDFCCFSSSLPLESIPS